MPPDDSNPYQYRGSSCVDFSKNAGHAEHLEVSGHLVSAIDPALVKEARSQILATANFSFAAQRSRWLFLIFLIAFRLLRPIGSPVLFWGAAITYGLGSIAAQTFLRRLMTLGIDTLDGTSPEQVTLQFREEGIRILCPQGHGHFAWGLVRGHKIVGSSLVLLMPTWFHPMGFVLHCEKCSVPLSEIDAFAHRCRLLPSNQKITNQLIPSIDLGCPTWSPPEVVASGILRNRDIATAYTEYWTAIRNQFFFSLVTLIGMILLCYAVVQSLTELPWLGLVAISPILLISAIRLARGVRVLFVPGTTVSDFEWAIHPEGIVKRTNSMQIAIPWEAFQESSIHDEEWRGILHLAPNHPVTLPRKYIATDEAWRQACHIAEQSVRRHKAPPPMDQAL